ncbi:MAG: PBP1A family penicillin-binding protein [Acidobacteriota bacterium]|nr:MAG: PBP1A family penicillin-binding protein [Acidobacteriota bacterium]
MAAARRLSGARSKVGSSHALFWLSYGLILLGTAVVGGLVGMVFGYAVELPRVEELQLNRPNVVTYVYAQDGRVIGQFAAEKRILVTYQQIPETIRSAILAAEDATFFEHPGIDFRRVVATAINDVINWEMKGASTLTMQMSKLRFTSTEKAWERKVKDALYAIDIEKTYSKEQIFTFYANQIPLGHGRYGIAAAADFYFHKELGELTLAESALIAGILPSPGRYSPILHPDRALVRRAYVLGRMRELDMITPEEFEEASNAPLDVKGRDDELTPAPYFIEWVRQYLNTKYQTDQIWEGGLKIYTTLDYDLQVDAEKAIRQGLREFDHTKRGWAGPVTNILESGETLDEYRHSDWGRLFYPGQLIHGLVLASNPESAEVRLGSYTAHIGLEEIGWTKKKRVDQVLKPGDVALFSLQEVHRESRIIVAALDQIPEVQGAAITLDNTTGAVRAMVGGFDFNYSKFNRATQALRQPGSIFKPFTYVAAMEAGFSPNDQVLDSPVEFQDALGRPYSPSNWDDEYKGLITIKQALAESRNVPTVRLANALGPERIVDVAHRFGLKQDFPPYLSIALGSVEVTLSEIVSAFSCFPNHGVRAEPYFVERVEDHNGVILEEHMPSVHDAVVTPDVADKMLYLMQEVVRRGSGRPLLELGRPMGGKTGTTNESTDVWFVGFTPRVTTGVWVGYDEKRSLGDRVFGNTLALPIWKQFMQAWLDGAPVERFDSDYDPDRSMTRIIETSGGDADLIGPLIAPEGEQPARRQSFEVEDIAPPPPSNN